MSRLPPGAAASVRVLIIEAPVPRSQPAHPSALSRSAVTTPRTEEGAGCGLSAQLETLYRKHGSWLLAVLRRRFGRELGEDLSQETFLRLWSYRPDDIRSPRALMMKVAASAAIELHRRQRVHAPEATGFAEPIDDRRWEAAAQDKQLLLKQIILSLPPKLRDVFVLSRFEGLTYEEIARRLNISPKTVEGRMTRALALCSAQLRD